jgi:chromosome segregation ATPase
MNRIPAFALLAILSALPLSGQTSQSDPQTLQQILSEVRGIHNDVRLGQTSQILLTEYEVQQSAVTRATQRRDDLRTRLTQLQANQKNWDTMIAQNEEKADNTMDPTQKKQLTDQANNLKSTLTSLKKQEQDTANDLQDAETALAKEQSTLNGIKDQLDNIVKKLQPAGN